MKKGPSRKLKPWYAAREIAMLAIAVVSVATIIYLSLYAVLTVGGAVLGVR